MAIFKSLFNYISEILRKKHIYLVYSLNFRGKAQLISPSLDYIRVSTMGLCYEEITRKGIPGSVDELGVYQANFARKLNQVFKDRKLYLFDTFEGFHPDDIHSETKHGFSDGNQDFSDTSVEKVMSLMTYPENCIVCKGHFPQTTEGIEDIFCFVSLDADLYEPIYQGLKYFYPRLAKGGYIFVHDYDNIHYFGVRKAVHQFCEENNIGFVPLPDTGGSVIVTK